VTCKEVSELMSAIIDGEFDQLKLSTVTDHINECRSCRNEYELERMTKNIVHRVLTPAKAPTSLEASIRQALASERQPEASSGGFAKLFQRPARTTAFALGVAGLGLLLIMVIPARSHRSHAQPNDGNIVHQTYNNFDKVLNSSFASDVKSVDPNMLTTSLSKCRCNLHMPILKQCQFVKGIHSLYKNDHIAEFVFARNNDPVYVYEVKLQDVIHAENSRMDPNVLKELMQSGWYFENHQPDCSLILMLVDSTIYCTVADMSKDQLLALLR
jgi:mycothiol system anti-sigma-R factor